MNLALFLLYPLAWLRVRLVLPALAVHGVLILSSAYSFGRVPLIGPRETLSFLAWSLGTVYVVFGWRRGRDAYTHATLPLILLLLAGSAISPPMVGPLPAVLRTVWFELHVVLSFLSYALFGIGAVFGALALLWPNEENELPQYRALLIGYALFSVAMIFGGIWAYMAWGTYWLWTPKELWTTIVWFFYGLYLHARLVRGWSGRPVSTMAVAGFLIVLFTYVGVGLLMKSSHAF
jgi:ABC-type transport system involved in cytochrome c biogenesis permease subunit